MLPVMCVNSVLKLGNSRMRQQTVQHVTPLSLTLLLNKYLDQISGPSSNLECLSINICSLLKAHIIVYKSCRHPVHVISKVLFSCLIFLCQGQKVGCTVNLCKVSFELRIIGVAFRSPWHWCTWTRH